MGIDLGRLLIRKVIIHEVPQHRKNANGGLPILSEIESPLSDNLKAFLHQKVIGSVGSSSAYKVCFLESSNSPVPRLVSTYINRSGEIDFVSASQEMAKYLYSVQTGINPPGLIAVIECEIKHQIALGILKIEKEEGVRLEQKTVLGKPTFDLQYIRELMLTKKTRLFKIGLFNLDEDDTDSIYGLVCDYQRDSTQNVIANFFLATFLGCQLYNDPHVQTKKFFDATHDFIDQTIENPVEKAKCLTHLMSELTNQKETIVPRIFAENSFDIDHQKSYLTHLESQGIDENQFDKDTKLVQRHLEKMLIEFTNGIQIVSPIDVYDSIKLTPLSDGTTKAEIVERIKVIHPK